MRHDDTPDLVTGADRSQRHPVRLQYEQLIISNLSGEAETASSHHVERFMG